MSSASPTASVPRLGGLRLILPALTARQRRYRNARSSAGPLRISDAHDMEHHTPCFSGGNKRRDVVG